MQIEAKKVRHVLGLSGGKDSAALAIFLKDKGLVRDIEYFFCDTGAELPEVYDYLERLEDYLGQEIVRLNSGRDFEHYLKLYGNFLPSVRQRWCTKEMKIRPFERWIGDDEAISYIGIRADENREGYISTRPNLKPVFPFKEYDIRKNDVFRILEESVGVPDYYKWRKRSGCYFCFFQTKGEWLSLKEQHPALFEKAKTFEIPDPVTQKQYTWVAGMTLDQLIEKARTDWTARPVKEKKSWQDELAENGGDGCLICHL